MVSRKLRTPVVVDTNVFVRAFRARSRDNPNQRVIRLWLQTRQFQLVVCQELVEEYLRIFSDVVQMNDEIVLEWQARFEHDRRSTLKSLGRRYTESRDPDDNVLMATAFAGNAQFLFTNDRDLLELPDLFQQSLPFQIMTPTAYFKMTSDQA